MGSRTGGWYTKVIGKARELATDGQLEKQVFDVKELRDLSEMVYMQDLREENGTKYVTYFENVKEGYSFEPYLNNLSRFPFLHTLARFRVGCHKLAVGRWQGIDGARRVCRQCDTGAIERRRTFCFPLRSLRGSEKGLSTHM